MSSPQVVFDGDRFQMKSGLWIVVEKYTKNKHIEIRFEESGYRCVVEGCQIQRQNIEDPTIKYFQKGQIFGTLKNGDLEIVEYSGTKNVIVRFLQTGYTTTVEACQVKRGTVKDWLLPRVSGKGFIGVGRHSAYIENQHKASWAYLKWSSILERCYAPDNEVTAEIYAGVSVHEEWHNFQNFAEWATKQVGYGNERWAIEKDIINKGSRIYAPENCCFLPQELNNLILKASRSRGEWPIGVSLHESNMKFTACVSGTGNSGYVGIYETPEEAFQAYKKVKEKRIKDLAEKWKSQIDPRAYEALMNYEVLITD